MPTVMLMQWKGVNKEQYDEVLRLLNFDKDPPKGGIFHVAGFDKDGLRVLDVWESQQAFETFQKQRLQSAVEKAGIQGTPQVVFFPVHNLYTPNLEEIRRRGASSLPG